MSYLDEEEERRIGRAVTVSSAAARGELEWADRKKGQELERAREAAAARLSGMTSQVMDVLEVALQSEDEGLRVKAALALLDRLVPKMRARNEEAEEIIEVVPESRKRLLEDIEEEMRKKLGG